MAAQLRVLIFGPTISTCSSRLLDDAVDDNAYAGSMFATVTSTTCARSSLTVSHLEVKRARRIDNGGSGGSDEAGTMDGEMAIANICTRLEVFNVGSVILFNGFSDSTELDH